MDDKADPDFWASPLSDSLRVLQEGLQRILASDDAVSQFIPDQYSGVAGSPMFLMGDLVGTTESLTAPANATADQIEAIQAANTLIGNAANTARGLREGGVHTDELRMMLAQAADGYETQGWQIVDQEGAKLACGWVAGFGAFRENPVFSFGPTLTTSITVRMTPTGWRVRTGFAEAPGD